MRPSILASLVLSMLSLTAQGQGPGAPTIFKINPPNWYATLPKPMLLVRGEELSGATFTLSDKELAIERTQISANGHWAQLWLSTSPVKPETVTLRATRGAAQAEAPYTFAVRRAPAEGMTGFSPRDVMYLILTDRFADGDRTNDGPNANSSADSPEAAAERAKPMGWHGGDLQGIAKHLDYLQSFGVTAVWPTPVYKNHSPVAYHGYHATDYYALDEHYGTLADLQSLGKALHARGMKLVIDMVPNHVGPLHPWVQDEPSPDWFHGTGAQHVQAEYNFKALIDPHAPDRDRFATLHGWFVNELPDMNTDSPAVAKYLQQNVIWWIEQTGADGLRYDTFPYVNREFWHELNFTLRFLYPHLTEVGEVSSEDPMIISAFADGATGAGVDTGLYTPFDFPLYHATRDVFANGQPMSHLGDILRADELYAHPERLVPFLGNHDESRFAGAVTDPALQKVAYAFLMTTRGTPQLYSGDEIAMPGGNDPDNRRDFPGGFAGSAPSITTDGFTAAGRTGNSGALFDWIAQLSKLRVSYPALACGAEQVLLANQDTLVYARYGNAGCSEPIAGRLNQSVLVALHRGSRADIHVDLRNTSASGCVAQGLGPAQGGSVANDALDINMGTEVALFACR